MGAINIDNVPYLPLDTTAESFGYIVEINFHEDSIYDNGTEYVYEILLNEQSLYTACITVQDEIIVSADISGISDNIYDWSDPETINFEFQDNTLYMPAQFFKEALDTTNLLP